jgi:two-component system, NtrC family, sensor kinase
MLSAQRELELLRFLDNLSSQLKPMRDPQKALRHALRDASEFFGATGACLAVLRPGQRGADPIFAIPRNSVWDLDLLTRVVRHNHALVRRDIIIAPLQRRGGPWAAMAFTRSAPYDRHDERLVTRIAAAVAEAIQHMDRERMLGVRDRIDRKIMERIHPKDLFYQILDGLRSLTHYDHSSALLIREQGDAMLRLVAEQIAWTKAKSGRIGLELAVTDEVRSVLESGQVYGFDRLGDSWCEWSRKPVTQLAELLDYNRIHPAEGGERREGSMLCAPLGTREGILGVLKVAARHPGTLKPYDAELIEHFRSQAAVAIRNLTRTESLRARMLTAERKHAMADLARGVSHDVNNALGSILPLVQQMGDDVRSGKLESGVLLEDLTQIQNSLQVCRRIFGGMLAFARSSAHHTGYGRVRPAIETALAILKDGMERRGIDLYVEIPDTLAPVACAQTDLEQVFLNLLTNAREAMADGGRLTVRVQSGPETVVISIADTGCGIPAEHLARVQEPFFTTKSHGNGLGLSICRSILWQVGGRLSIVSHGDGGTRVDVAVPCVLATEHAIES